MAKRGGRRGGSAARSAAAKKGWETRRRGGSAAKGGGKKTKVTAPSKGKGSVAERKRAMNGEVTSSMLDRSGRTPRNAQRERYIGAQNRSAYEATQRGKGSKASRRVAALAAKPKPASSKPKKRGASTGPRGGKVGTRTEQRKSAAAQASRTRSFSSKAAPSSAKAAYKAARAEARFLRRQNGGKAGDAFSKVRRMERTRRATPKRKRKS